jgi:hypothetical protein
MDLQEIKHGRYLIRAGKLKSGPKGFAFLGDKKVLEVSAKNVEKVIENLKNQLDKIDMSEKQGRRAPHIATVKEYTNAFSSINLPAGHVAMLTAHASAQNQTMTLAELARAVDYEDQNGAQVQYGTLAKKIIDFCNLEPRQEEGWQEPNFTSSLAEDVEGDFVNSRWAWRMHDEVVEALKSLNMV